MHTCMHNTQQERAMSTLQNNVIERNVRAGVVVTDNSNPTLSQNIIRDGKHAGLLIRHNAHGK
jgi:parallel beta-helix repeat protein